MTLTFESNVYLYITSTDLCTRITVSNERVTHVLRFWAKGVKLPGNSEYQCPEVYLFGRITIRDISRSIYLWYSALLIFMFVYLILFYFILCYRIVCFVSFAYDCFFIWVDFSFDEVEFAWSYWASCSMLSFFTFIAIYFD